MASSLGKRLEGKVSLGAMTQWEDVQGAVPVHSNHLS